MIHLYAVAAAVGVLTVFFEVAYQAYLPALVGGDHVVEGNEKLQMTRSAADVGGSALGGLFMQVLGIPLAIFVDALSFVMSLAGLVTIRHREQRSDRHSKSVGPRGLMSELWEGLLVLLGDARLRALMGTMSMVNFGFAAGTALVLIFAYRDLRLTPGEVGLAFGAGGVGLIIGAVLARRVVGIFGLGPTVVLAIVVMGLGFALLPLASAGLALIVLAACQFAVGMADGILNVHIISLVQAITPAHLMGRVGGSALSVVFGVSTFGSMVGGILALAIGVKFVLLITGLFIAAGSTFVLASPIRRLAEQPAPAPSH